METSGARLFGSTWSAAEEAKYKTGSVAFTMESYEVKYIDKYIQFLTVYELIAILFIPVQPSANHHKNKKMSFVFDSVAH